jgi:hypothetical protein
MLMPFTVTSDGLNSSFGGKPAYLQFQDEEDYPLVYSGKKVSSTESSDDYLLKTSFLFVVINYRSIPNTEQYLSTSTPEVLLSGLEESNFEMNPFLLTHDYFGDNRFEGERSIVGGHDAPILLSNTDCACFQSFQTTQYREHTNIDENIHCIPL